MCVSGSRLHYFLVWNIYHDVLGTLILPIKGSDVIFFFYFLGGKSPARVTKVPACSRTPREKGLFKSATLSIPAKEYGKLALSSSRCWCVDALSFPYAIDTRRIFSPRSADSRLQSGDWKQPHSHKARCLSISVENIPWLQPQLGFWVACVIVRLGFAQTRRPWSYDLSYQLFYCVITKKGS